MKKGLKNLLIAALSPLALAAADNKLNISWEVSFQDSSLATENQFELSSSEAFVGGSVTSQDTGGSYGVSARAKTANHTFGQFKSPSQKSYFNGLDRQRDTDLYAGVRFQRAAEGNESEVFAGAKLGKFLLNSVKGTDNSLENKVYADFNGKIIGVANEQRGGIESSGLYYLKGDLGAQYNFNKENRGPKVILRNLLPETLIDSSERLDAEVGYGEATKASATVRYNVSPQKGPLRSMYLGVRVGTGGAQNPVFENAMTFGGKNPVNFRLTYEVEPSKASVGVDFKY